MPAQGVECGWKPAGWHVLTLLNSRPPSLPQPPEPTFAAPPKVLPEHHELVVGRGALLNSRIPSLPRPQEPISCSVNEHVFPASRAWDRASVGQARIHTCLGAEAGATMLTNTHTHNTHRLLPPSRLISKIHIWGWGWGLGGWGAGGLGLGLGGSPSKSATFFHTLRLRPWGWGRARGRG